MIQTERQYGVTKTKLQDLEQKLSVLKSQQELTTNIHPRLMKMERVALESQIQAMYAEIAEYENLKTRTAIESINSSKF
jgi:hypothetical protein